MGISTISRDQPNSGTVMVQQVSYANSASYDSGSGGNSGNKRGSNGLHCFQSLIPSEWQPDWELRAKTHKRSWLTRTSTQLAGGWKYYINLVHPNRATKASVTYSDTGHYTYDTPMVTTFTKVAIEIDYQPVTQVTLVVNDFAYASTAPAPTSDQDQHVAFGNATDCRQIWSPAQGRAAVKQMDSNKDGVVDSSEFAAAGGTKTIIDLRGTPFAVKGGAAAFQSSGLPITGSFNCKHDDQYCVLQVIALPYGTCVGTTWTPVLSVIDNEWYQDVLYAARNGWVEDPKFIVDTTICLEHGADLSTRSECSFAIQALGLGMRVKDKKHRRKFPAGCSIRKKGGKMVAFFNRHPDVDQQKKHAKFQTVCGFPKEFCLWLAFFRKDTFSLSNCLTSTTAPVPACSASPTHLCVAPFANFCWAGPETFRLNCDGSECFCDLGCTVRGDCCDDFSEFSPLPPPPPPLSPSPTTHTTTACPADHKHLCNAALPNSENWCFFGSAMANLRLNCDGSDCFCDLGCTVRGDCCDDFSACNKNTKACSGSSTHPQSQDPKYLCVGPPPLSFNWCWMGPETFRLNCDGS